MMYPLVTELAAAGIPVTVTCRVLRLSRQPYYRWLADPITPSEVVEAYRANALFDARQDDPSCGHRLLADEARDAGEGMSARTAWRIASAERLVERVRQNPTATARNPAQPFMTTSAPSSMRTAGPDTCSTRGRVRTELWLTDITEHKTAEGKLYLCAIKDVHSGTGSSGYSIDSRMKSRPGRPRRSRTRFRMRGDVAGCVVHSATGAARFRSRKFSARADPPPPGRERWAEWPRAETTPPWNRSSPCCRRTSSTAAPGPPATSCASRSVTWIERTYHRRRRQASPRAFDAHRVREPS